MTSPKTICTLCGSELNKVLTETIRGGLKRRVYHCARCDLGVLEGGFTEGDPKEYYGGKEYWEKHTPHLTVQTSPEDLFKTYVGLQEDRLKLLRPHFSKKKTLLEIGCSAGMFLHHARKHVGKVMGADYDAAAAAHAARVCKCETFGVDIADLPISEESVDIICAFQTLEHVADPLGFLTAARGYLKKGGVIAIEVPNLYDALAALYDLPRYYEFYFHDAHLWYFAEKSLLKLMKRAGFEGKVYFLQDYNVLNHLHWADTDTPKQGGVSQLAEPSLPLRNATPRAARADALAALRKFDADYKKMLVRHKLTSNIMFIGKKISK